MDGDIHYQVAHGEPHSLPLIITLYPSPYPRIYRHIKSSRITSATMSFLNSLLPGCFPAPRKYTATAAPNNFSEKAYLQQFRTQETASGIVSVLLSAESAGKDLDIQVQSIVHQAGGWYQSLAIAVLETLVQGIQEGKLIMNEAMKQAWEKAKACADGVGGFVSKHPVWTAAIVTVVVLGMLVILAPYILEWLGFSALGPVEGESSF